MRKKKKLLLISLMIPAFITMPVIADESYKEYTIEDNRIVLCEHEPILLHSDYNSFGMLQKAGWSDVWQEESAKNRFVEIEPLETIGIFWIIGSEKKHPLVAFMVFLTFAALMYNLLDVLLSPLG